MSKNSCSLAAVHILRNEGKVDKTRPNNSCSVNIDYKLYGPDSHLGKQEKQNLRDTE